MALRSALACVAPARLRLPSSPLPRCTRALASSRGQPSGQEKGDDDDENEGMGFIDPMEDMSTVRDAVVSQVRTGWGRACWVEIIGIESSTLG